MSFMPWNDRYLTGVAEIDNDHRILFDLVSQYHDALYSGIGPEKAALVFEILLEYTHNHFAREESLMERLGYPGLDEHREHHKILTENVAGMYRRHQEGDASLSGNDILAFLNNWLRFHVMEEDMAWRDYFVANGKEAAMQQESASDAML